MKKREKEERDRKCVKIVKYYKNTIL